MDNKVFVLPQNMDSLGVLGYSIVVNKQVHNYQIDLLEDYLKKFNLKIDDTVLASILDGQENAISFNTAIEAFALEEETVKEQLLYFVYLLSSIDTNINSSEQFVIEQMCQVAKLNKERILDIARDAQIQANITRTDNNVLFKRPFSDKERGFKAFWKRFVDWLLHLFGIRKHNSKHGISKEDEAYKTAIQKCAIIAREDFSAVKPSYNTLINSCGQLIKETENIAHVLQLGTGVSAETAKIISIFTENLSTNVLNESKRVQYSLIQKERSVPDFTISLVGRTKSGKSTLHSILTNHGRDKIGTGAQRTTRYNRVYQWNLLKLIDTPGIGSAEANGRNDDAIAESVLGESDVICLVVRDDSVLQDVLEFIEKIASLNKPIIVLLNHMENITSPPSKLTKFINNPTGWLIDQGEGSLNGHIKRIQRYADEHGFGHLIQFYPVFLLPALLAGDTKFEDNNRVLWEGSNIDIFIEQLKKWITESGPIKRSQTILDEASQLLYHSQVAINEACVPIDMRLETLKKDRPKTNSLLVTTQNKVLTDLRKDLEEVFGELATEHARDFANEYYSHKGDLSQPWADYLKTKGFEERINGIISNHAKHFEKQLKDTLDDFFEDMYHGINFSFKISIDQKMPLFDYRSASAILGGLLDCAGAVVLAIGTLNLLGWILTGLGVAVGLFASFLKPRAKRVQEAKDTIYRTVKQHIEDNRDAKINEYISKFKQCTDTATQKVDSIYAEIIFNLEKIQHSCNRLTVEYSTEIEKLDRIYAWRILKAVCRQKIDFSLDLMDRYVYQVDRSKKGEITIIVNEHIDYDESLLQQAIADKIIIKERKNEQG